MCRFGVRRPDVVHELEQDDALRAFRAFSVDLYGVLISPYQNTRWPKGVLVIPGVEGKRGIYSFKSLRAAVYDGADGNNLQVVTQVDVWGTVLEYRHRPASYYYANYVGYRSSRCRVVKAWTSPKTAQRLRAQYPKMDIELVPGDDFSTDWEGIAGPPRNPSYR